MLIQSSLPGDWASQRSSGAARRFPPLGNRPLPSTVSNVTGLEQGTMKFPKKRLMLPLAGLVTLLVVFAGYREVAQRQDQRHAQHYALGQRINNYLGEYSKAFTAAFHDGDLTQFADFYSDRYAAPGRGQWALRKARQQDGVFVNELAAVGGADYDKAAVVEEFSQYLGELSAIEKLACKIYLIERPDPDDVILTTKFFLDAVDREGRLFQDRRFIRWRLVNESPGSVPPDWKIVSDELVHGVRTAGGGSLFTKVDLQSAGIDFRHARDPKLDLEFSKIDPGTGEKKLKFGMVQYAPSGVATVDYNQDGRPDIFFPDGIRSRLYRNDGPGDTGEPAFTDVTSEAGLEGLGEAVAGIFADVDNDGDRDLFVTRYMAPNRFFYNNGDGIFAERSAEAGLDLNAPSMSATFLDFDRDGYLDLFVGVYGNAFEQVPRIMFFARNGERSRLYRNVALPPGEGIPAGRRTFVDVSDQAGITDTGWTLAVAAGDYDNNGYPDLALANDFGQKVLYRNNGDGSFTDTTKHAGVWDIGPGMSAAFGDINDDEWLDLYTANVQSNQRWFGEDVTVSQYLRNVLKTKWAILDATEYFGLYNLIGSDWVNLGTTVGEGNSLFANNGDGTFRELKDSRTNMAGWGWSTAFIDVDNDSHLDIYAANGWISNDPATDL